MNQAVVRRFLEAHAEFLTGLSLVSLLALVGSLLLVPWLVLQAPHDVFVRAPRGVGGAGPWRLIVRLLRNVLGVALILLGVLMLILPGQGLLTMVVGLCLMDLPRKRELLRQVVARPAVWRALAWIRARGGKPPFDHP